jgi:hypothetical protein
MESFPLFCKSIVPLVNCTNCNRGEKTCRHYCPGNTFTCEWLDISGGIADRKLSVRRDMNWSASERWRAFPVQIDKPIWNRPAYLIHYRLDRLSKPAAFFDAPGIERCRYIQSIILDANEANVTAATCRHVNRASFKKTARPFICNHRACADSRAGFGYIFSA